MNDNDENTAAPGNSQESAPVATRKGKKEKGMALVINTKMPTVETVERPSFAVYSGWTEVEGKRRAPGVWWHGLTKGYNGEDGAPVDYFVCEPLFVEAETEDTETGAIGRLLRFKHRRGWVEWVMAMEALAGGDEVIKALLRLGLAIEYRRRKMVLEYIASHHHMDKVLETTTAVGWHRSGAFVLPNRILGSETVKYQDSGRAMEIFSSVGDLATWQKEVATLCQGNAVLILSVCCALSGPLLHRLGVAGGGFHLVGDSSSGKSLAQRVAATVWGHPDRFAASWAVTKNGLEIEAAARNHTVLLLDEIKRADPRYIQEMAYSLANGTGKGTMNAERQARAKLVWLLFFLSSGERPLAEHAALSGSPAHAGAELRMVDVNAGTRKFRAFDDAHGMTGEAFHRALSVAVTDNYGHIGTALVEAMIADKSSDSIPKLYAKIRENFTSDNAQAGRVADRFCATATAGEYAISKGLLPWRAGTAVKACKLLFGEWLDTVGSGNSEDRQILQGIADFLDAHGDSRFSSIKDFNTEPRIVHNRAGYYEQGSSGDSRVYLFMSKPLKEAVGGFAMERILLALETAGALLPGDDGRRQKAFRKPGGQTSRFYVVDPQKLETHN